MHKCDECGTKSVWVQLIDKGKEYETCLCPYCIEDTDLEVTCCDSCGLSYTGDEDGHECEIIEEDTYRQTDGWDYKRSL